MTGRILGHGVQGGDDRCPEGIQELKDHASVGPAEQAEFVLQGYDVHAGGIDALGGASVVIGHVIADVGDARSGGGGAGEPGRCSAKTFEASPMALARSDVYSAIPQRRGG